MDKFEQMMKDVKGMSPKEMAGAEEKYEGTCNCPSCPTHNKCAKNAKELLFCITGKSFICISENKAVSARIARMRPNSDLRINPSALRAPRNPSAMNMHYGEPRWSKE